MHTIEAFASSCGLKISKPYIYEKYYPIYLNKYIVIETNDVKYQSKNYDYWQEVVNLILPYLKENDINILQFCNQNDPKLINTYSVTALTYNQRAYLIKNSICYIGSNSFGLQIASHYNKKIIGLYSNTYASQNKPYWSSSDEIKLIEAFESNSKPSYMPQENPKVINNLKPDVLSNSILDLLDIKHKFQYKFSNIGNNYNNKTIEMLPNMIIDPTKISTPNIIIRMDLEHNEQFLEMQLSTMKCILLTNKTISEDIIKKYKQNILQVIYKIEEDNDHKFVQFLKNQNISYVLVSHLPQPEIDKIKINYMDLGLISKINNANKNNYPNAKYYKSNRFILSNNKLYMSEAAVQKDLPIKDFNNNIQEVIDTELFWDNADNYAFLVD